MQEGLAFEMRSLLLGYSFVKRMSGSCPTRQTGRLVPEGGPSATAAAPAARAASPLLAEAVTAINGPVAPGPERDFGILAALGADSREHFPAPAAEPAAAAEPAVAESAAAAATPVGSASLSARRTPLRLVGVAFVRMILLVIGRENERGTALNAC